MEGKFPCSVCGHQLLDLAHFFDCPVSEPPRHAIFGSASFIFDLLFRHWDVVGSPWSFSTSSSLGRGRVAPPSPTGHFAVSCRGDLVYKWLHIRSFW